MNKIKLRMQLPSRILLLCAMLWVIEGCTVTPDPMRDNRPSFSENEQNSGFIGWTAGGSGIITLKAREKYNALIEKYGNAYIPPLKYDEGITRLQDFCLIDKEHLVKFATMNRWFKEGRKAVTPQ